MHFMFSCPKHTLHVYKRVVVFQNSENFHSLVNSTLCMKFERL